MKLKYMGWALAALGMSSAVQAQQASSVTIYGRVDVGLMRQWGIGPSKTSEDHYHTSRLGFRGVEDLGGGLSALLKMETRFLGKNGAEQDAATYWNDETYVGLQSKTYGTLKLGRIYSPFYLAVAGRIDPFNGDGIGSMTGLTSLGHNLSPGNPYDAAKGFVTRDVRHNNSIDYASPTFAGFSVQVQKSLSETAGKPSGISTAIRYDSPTLFAQTGYERQAFSQNAYTTHIGGGYVFGPARLSAGYTRGYYSDDEYARGNKASSAILGLTYTTNGPLVILAAASRIRMDQPTLLDASKGTGSNLTKIAVGADYYLSKRTKVYAHLAHFSDPMSILFVGNSKRAMVGIDHAF
jgi:general bacterial porin, GBP family